MNENAKKWVEALRSGEYEQTTENLQDHRGYCCLGVACDLYEKSTGNTLVNTDGVIFGAVLSEDEGLIKVQEWIGLKYEDGSYLGDSLTDLNDQGLDFIGIADIIESEPEGLFKEAP